MCILCGLVLSDFIGGRGGLPGVLRGRDEYGLSVALVDDDGECGGRKNSDLWPEMEEKKTANLSHFVKIPLRQQVCGRASVGNV